VHGKLIGGYTPLVWNKSQSGPIIDQYGTSFIFSLTNNHKFTLDRNKTAITQYSNHGPMFGTNNPDFGIRGNSDSIFLDPPRGQMNLSWGLINQSYSNSNYTLNNGDSYMKFNGNTNKLSNTMLKEW
jgi:hypothetical protein